MSKSNLPSDNHVASLECGRLDYTSDDYNDVGDEHALLATKSVGQRTGDERSEDVACCIPSVPEDLICKHKPGTYQEHRLLPRILAMVQH